MVPQAYLDQPQRTDDVLSGGEVFAGGQRHTVGVVVAEHDAFRPAPERRRDDVLHLEAHHPAVPLLEPVYTFYPAAAVQRKEQGFLLFCPGEAGFQVSRQPLSSCQCTFGAGAAVLVVPAHLGQEMQHPGAGRADARHTAEFFFTGFQHTGKAAEPLQQRVGDAVGIPAGVGDVEQIFQCLVGCEAFQPVLLHTGAHPLPMALVAYVLSCHSCAPLFVVVSFIVPHFRQKTRADRKYSALTSRGE